MPRASCPRAPSLPARRRFLVWSALGLLPAVARADAGRPIGVLVPEVAEPFRAVFARIVEGIAAQSPAPVAALPVTAGSNPQDLAAELRRREVQAVVALGRHGLRAAEGLPHGVPIVIGGVLSVPESDTRTFLVHSLAPDPALVLARLRAAMPGVRRLLVVYDPRQNDWLLKLARDAAAGGRGPEIVAREAADVASAVHQWQQALASAVPATDALWLPPDSTTAEEGTVLPLVLEQAWGRRLSVVASSVAHVRQGALFCLYPDNLRLGRSLAVAAGGAAAGDHGIVPLKDVLVAANARTAAHLGLDGSRALASPDLAFPER